MFNWLLGDVPKITAVSKFGSLDFIVYSSRDLISDNMVTFALRENGGCDNSILFWTLRSLGTERQHL